MKKVAAFPLYNMAVYCYMNSIKNLYLFSKNSKNYHEIPIAAEAQTNFFRLPMT